MFIITQDLLDDGLAVGTMGPSDITEDDEKTLRLVADGQKPDGLEISYFYMHDDDGVRYYGGYWVADPDSDEFEPLDCFGMPNAGCTSIRMKHPTTGKYEIV
jgi:hypothetical protein